MNLDPALLAVAAAVFTATLVIVWAAWRLLNPPRTPADRLQELTAAHGPTLGPVVVPDRPVMTGTIAKVAAPTDPEERNALRTRLLQAGFRSRNAVETFSTVRFATTFLAPLVTLAWRPLGDGTTNVLIQVLGLALLGYYAPSLYVQNRLIHRREDLLRAFPDALDLLVASVEAGLGLDAAFRRVAQEMEDAAPLLSAELKAVNHEMAAGVPRLDALRNLQKRTGLAEFHSLVNVLAQAERFGTPVAHSLRVHAQLVRTRRMQQAEEKAAKVSPKLTVAMICFILPCLIVILIGPAVVNVRNDLLPALAATGSR